jgi:tetratricopeptide (TPR) repeat protein
MAGIPLQDPAADLDSLRALYEEAIVTFTDAGDDEGLALASWRLSAVLRLEGRNADAVACLERGLAAAEAHGDPATRRTVVFSLVTSICGGPMPVTEGIARLEELRAASGDDGALEAAVTRHLSLLLAMARRFDESRACERLAAPVLEDAWHVQLSWSSLTTSAEAKLLAGDRAGAARDLEAKWRAFQGAAGDKPDRLAMDAAFRLADLYAEDGRWDEAERCLAAYRGLDDRLALAVRTRLAAHRGNLGEAERLARERLAVVERSDAPNSRAAAWVGLADVLRGAGRTAEADAAVERALALYEQKGNVAAAERLRASALT